MKNLLDDRISFDLGTPLGYEKLRDMPMEQLRKITKELENEMDIDLRVDINIINMKIAVLRNHVYGIKESRERSIALTKLEEFEMWISKAFEV